MHFYLYKYFMDRNYMTVEACGGLTDRITCHNAREVTDLGGHQRQLGCLRVDHNVAPHRGACMVREIMA